MKELATHARFEVPERAKVHVFDTHVSMVNGFPGLEKLIRKRFKGEEIMDNIFLFFNKKMNYCKIMWFKKSGWCMFSKKLIPSTTFGLTLIPGSSNQLFRGNLGSFVNNVVAIKEKKAK